MNKILKQRKFDEEVVHIITNNAMKIKTNNKLTEEIPVVEGIGQGPKRFKAVMVEIRNL